MKNYLTTQECPLSFLEDADGNMNYSDAGCDEYDRIAHMYVCQGECFETQYFFDADETTCIEGGNSWDSEGGVCYTTNYLNNVSQDDCPDGFWDYNRDCSEIN